MNLNAGNTPRVCPQNEPSGGRETTNRISPMAKFADTSPARSPPDSRSLLISIADRTTPEPCNRIVFCNKRAIAQPAIIRPPEPIDGADQATHTPYRIPPVEESHEW